VVLALKYEEECAFDVFEWCIIFLKVDGSGQELDGIWLFCLVLSRLVSEINKFFPVKSDLNLQAVCK